MHKICHRVMGILLCIAMISNLLPVNATAEEYESVLYDELPTPFEPTEARTVTITSDVTFAKQQKDGTRTGWDGTVSETFEIPELPLEHTDISTSVNTFSIRQENGTEHYSFTTFEDLKVLASGMYSNYTYVTYESSEPLIITESIRIPDNFNLNLGDAELIIPEGVEFATADIIHVSKITVRGIAQIGYLYVKEVLNVSGSLYVSSGISLEINTVLIGNENITFTNDWACYQTQMHVSSETDLIATISAMGSTENTRYEIGIVSPFTISQNISIPENGSLYTAEDVSLTIASGITLELNCNTVFNGNVIVEGTVVNNDFLSIYHDRGGHMEITAGGTYSGNGRLHIFSDSITDPAIAVSGLDLSHYELKEIRDSIRYLELRYVNGMTKLATPANPEWGFDHERWAGWDEELEKPIYNTVTLPGSISWQPVEPTQAEVEIQVFREGESTPYEWFGWGFDSMTLPNWRSIDSFCNSDPETGNYYFTITALGDYINYFNSDPAISDTWTYVRPSAKVDNCSNLSWDWPSASFSIPSDMSNVGGYEVAFYYSPTADGIPQERSTHWTRYDAEYGFSPDVGDWMIQDCGVGYYYFKVRALSSDITIACNGDWSEMSPAYNLKELAGNVHNDLQDVIQNSGNLTDDEIRDAVQSMNTEDLKSAMLADENVLDNIATLEAKVGGAAGVEVTMDASAFDSSKVSIVGANLNDFESTADPIKLVIDKPEKDHVLDAVYDNSVAVKFSMSLNNVEDTENLKVPVKVTLPIPNTINPGFLVILHYHANGEVEELSVGDKVHVFTKSGQKYASFVLDSFSDFIMTQQSETVDIPTMAMFRMYDPNGHEHFYTGSEEERENLVTAGWNYEGVGFNFPLTTGDPVYRLYDRNNTCEHLYTMSEDEKNTLLNAGWEYEGIAFNSADSTQVPQYRLHNPNETRGAYHFTTDLEERDYLISLGWEYQGIGWYSCWQ